VQRKPGEIESQDAHEAHLARLAWLGAFLLTLVLILGLGVVRSAQAAPTPALVSGIVQIDDEGEEEAEEDGDEELEAEACEIAEEEGEEVECEGAEEVLGPPSACLLSGADAAVSADLVHGKLRLALRYTAAKPATVAVDYWLRGSRGPLNLEGAQKHLGRGGVLHLTQSLTDAQAKKVAAAKSFTVTVDPVNAPDSCGAFLDQHLSVRKAIGGGDLWTDTETTFRHARHARRS
jgi:hypothetical protein